MRRAKPYLDFIQKIIHHPVCFPLFLLAAALVSYGLYLFKMGFYWDDWQAIFIGKLGNPTLFWEYFSYDRPISAWTYLLSYPLLGSNPALWQIFTITLRWLTSLGLWWTLRGVWPDHTHEAGWVALLFLVYPGFTQQPIAVAYSQHFITYALFTLSLALTVWSLRRPRWFWLLTALAVLASLLQLLTMEYFAGLELLRPVLIGFVVVEAGQSLRARLSRVGKIWWPYAAALVAFAAFRFVFYPRLSPDPGANAPVLLLNWLHDPLTQTIRFLQIMLQDLVHMTVFAYANPLNPAKIDLTYTFWLFSWAAGALVSVAAIAFLGSLDCRQSGERDDGRAAYSRQALLLGLLGIVLGGLPVWVTDRQAIQGLWSDRFLLAPMFGVAILAVALVYWLGRSRARRAVALAVLLAISISAQLRNVDEYRRSWVTQRNYYWQMVWRMPALEPGTMILSTSLPFTATSDYAMSFAANLLYAPDGSSTQIPYLYLSASRYRNGLLNGYQEGTPVEYTLRSVRYTGSTSQAVVVDRQPGNACVRVLAPQDFADPKLDREQVDLSAISHLDQIIPDASPALSSLKSVFGPEPAHEWCYYYEKADLARQAGDWQAVLALYDEATAQGLHTKYGWELQPFIEASAMQGDWQRAVETSTAAAGMTASLERALCNVWARVDLSTPASAEKQAAFDAIRARFSCSADD